MDWHHPVFLGKKIGVWKQGRVLFVFAASGSFRVGCLVDGRLSADLTSLGNDQMVAWNHAAGLLGGFNMTIARGLPVTQAALKKQIILIVIGLIPWHGWDDPPKNPPVSFHHFSDWNGHWDGESLTFGAKFLFVGHALPTNCLVLPGSHLTFGHIHFHYALAQSIFIGLNVHMAV